MVEPTRCGDIADALVEVATGAASGPDRARVLSHLAECPDCRRELEELTRVADEVLLVAPEHDPPAGFEGAVLARIAELSAEPDDDDVAAEAAEPMPGPAAEHAGPRAGAHPDATVEPHEPATVTPLTGRRRWPQALAAAAGVAAAAAGISAGVVWQSTSEDRDLAASYRETLDVANGRYFHAAPVHDTDGDQVGHVFLYQGEPSWVFTVLDDTVEPGTYDVVVATAAGTESVADCEVSEAGGGTGATIDADIRDIDQIDLVAADGTVFTADLAG
ncbi:anti-sigma factor family protein [Jiangella asiatica]|uniref:Putative zinc-finger domain-containing protein n=1 Tax=Jiangella asiatica TaxID=2530372 RepID=A0A4R5DLW2_9ACTN|nr:zf-HC2 domain-containing protein [Jiangella asiatica]TDE12971.1 hypothetical protein E1269_06115 [Jiangella asiatica]